MRGKRTCVCAHCGATFYTPLKSGPAAQYCRPAHRQRAYEERRRAREAQDSAATTDEVQTLRTRVRLLELDNRKLREELAETEAEVHRLDRELHPPPSAVAQFAAREPGATPGPTEASATRRRRMRRNQV